MLAVRLSIKSLGLISSIILARLLMPEDFGIVALCMAVYAFVRMIRELGFGQALIQNQEATRALYDTAWTMQVAFSSIAAVLLLIAAPFAVDFYADPRLQPIFYVLALICFLTGMENIGVIDFQKNMTFDKVFYLQVTPKILSFLATIVLAYYLRNYWALVIGMLANKVLSLVMSYTLQNYRPRFHIGAWQQLIGFSSWLMINNLIAYLNRHGQNLLLAKMGGVSLVGLVTVATEFSTIVANEVIQPINTAAYPGYARVSHARERLRNMYFEVLRAVAMIAIPGGVGIAALAPLFVPVLLGEKWISAIPLIPYIALASIFMSLMAAFDMIFMSVARQRITTFMVALRISVFFPLMYILLQKQGATGVGQAVLLANLVVFPLYMIMLRRTFEFEPSAFFSSILRPVFGASVMYMVVTKVVHQLGPMRLELSGVVALFTVTALGAMAFVLCVFLSWICMGKPDGFERKVIVLVKNKVSTLL